MLQIPFELQFTIGVMLVCSLPIVLIIGWIQELQLRADTATQFQAKVVLQAMQDKDMQDSKWIGDAVDLTEIQPDNLELQRMIDAHFKAVRDSRGYQPVRTS